MKNIIITIIGLFIATSVFAKEIKRPDSYNYQRGTEAYQKQNYNEALEYFQKELQDNKKNGYAYALIADMYFSSGMNGEALENINNAIKYLPEKDKIYCAFAYENRGKIYANLGEWDKALEDYTKAKKFAPEETSICINCAFLYINVGEFDLAKQELEKVIEIEPTNIMAHMGLGKIANSQERYYDAIKEFDYILNLDNTNTEAYLNRSISYKSMNKINEAIDDCIMSLKGEDTDDAYFNMLSLVPIAKDQLINKLKIEENKDPEINVWPYYIGSVYEESYDYDTAIEYYHKSLALGKNKICTSRISSCYQMIGQTATAVAYAKEALSMDPTNGILIYTLADALNEDGKPEEAITVINDFIQLYPEEGIGYQRRANYKQHLGYPREAVEDYSLAIAANPQDYTSYLMRGLIYSVNGEMDLANEDLMKIIEADTIPSNNSMAQFAYAGLGMFENAYQFENKILEQGPAYIPNYYGAASLCGLVDDNENALKYLQISLENGFRRFGYIKTDLFLNGVRETQEYKDLMAKYDTAPAIQAEAKTYVDKTIEIPFTKDKQQGILKVQCKMNGLPLYFILDTGAADISLSSVEATFMLKNGYLSSNDIIGTQNYVLANGDIVEGTIINIREVEFGEAKLHNVKAGVSHNQEAPLLLGQSVLERLGKVEIDYDRSVLKITYKEEQK